MKRKLRVLGICLGMLLALSPVNAFAAEETAIDIQTDSFSYHTTSPYRLQDMPSIWHMDRTDTLTAEGTTATLMITGVYQYKDSDSSVYTYVRLNYRSAERGKFSTWRWGAVMGDDQPEVGDLIEAKNFTVMESNPPQLGAPEGYRNLGNACDILGEEFMDVIRHELRLSYFYGLGEYTLDDVELPPVSVSPEIMKPGDVYQDDELNIIDVIGTNKYLLGASVLDERAEIAADVNWDGTVDTTDSLMILKEVVEVTKDFVEK